MADFVLARKSRNIASSAVHIFLNILLGLSAVLLTVFSGNPAPGLVLILLSKWRVFAVRSRYLLINIKANLVDFIVGFSVVLLAYFAGNSLLPIDFGLIALYIIWLLFIKPLFQLDCLVWCRASFSRGVCRFASYLDTDHRQRFYLDYARLWASLCRNNVALPFVGDSILV